MGKFKLTSYSNLELNHLALITIYFLYNQHSSGDTKEFYTRTIKNALNQQYDLLNDERNYLTAKINSIQEKSLEKIEVESDHSQEIICNIKKHSQHLSSEVNQMKENNEQLEKEYNQLKVDFQQIIQENELLKDLNPQICHENLHEKNEHGSCEIMNNNKHQIKVIKQMTTEQQSLDEQEISRLKKIIEEIEFANEDLNSQLYNSINSQLVSKIYDEDNRQSCLRVPFVDNQHHDSFHTSLKENILSENEQTQTNDKIISEEEHHFLNIGQENIAKNRTDNETQTNNENQDKLFQVNHKLKRALQTIKEKIHRIFMEKPELFRVTTDDTIERLDHIINTLHQQSIEINHSQIEISQLQSTLKTYKNQLQSVNSATFEEKTIKTLHEDYQRQIDQCQDQLLEKDQENHLLKQRINEIEFALRNTSDKLSSTMTKLDVLVYEHNVVLESHSQQSADCQQEIQLLEEELTQLKQISIDQEKDKLMNEERAAFQEMIRQQSEAIKQLNGKCLLQIQLEDELHKQKTENLYKINELQQQNEILISEHAQLLKIISTKRIDNQTQTDDYQYEKMRQVNNELKRILQSFKDKIHRLVSQNPILFDGVSEETTERLEHLISVVEKQLQNEANQLESTSINENYQKQIDQLQQKLVKKDDEKALLCEHLDEIELELKTTIHNHDLLVTRYNEEFESLEKQKIHSLQYQSEIEQLTNFNNQMLRELKRSVKCEHAETQTTEDIAVLHHLVEEQSTDLKEKLVSLKFQVEYNEELVAELEREREQHRFFSNNYKIQIENLEDEREHLLKEIKENILTSIKTSDSEYEKSKYTLELLEEKLTSIVNEQPSLFDGISTESIDCLDRLISIVNDHVTQMNVLKSEQYLETDRSQIDHDHLETTEKLVSAATSIEGLSGALPPVEDYEKKINQLQHLLNERNIEYALLEKHLNKVEAELKQMLIAKYELRREEQSELIQQQAKHLIECQHDIETLHNQTLACQSREIQTDDDQHEKLIESNDILKHTLQTIDDQIENIISARPDLFKDIPKDTNERLDSFNTIIEKQSQLLVMLQTEHDHYQEKYKSKADNLKNSFDKNQQEIDEYISSCSQITHEIETQTNDYLFMDDEYRSIEEVKLSQTSETNDNEANTWFDASSHIIDTDEIEQQQFHDIDDQYKMMPSTLSEQLSDNLNANICSFKSELLIHNSSQTDINSFTIEEIQQIVFKYSTFLSVSNENILENIHQIDLFIESLQSEIIGVKSSFELFRNHVEKENLRELQQLKSTGSIHASTQTLGLSIVEEHQKKIEKLQENELIYQKETKLLIEQRNQAVHLLSQQKEEDAEKLNNYELTFQLQTQERNEQSAKLNEKLSISFKTNSSQTTCDVDNSELVIHEYQAQIDNLLHGRIILMEEMQTKILQPSKVDAETQLVENSNSLPSPDQSISRRMFEQEILVWSTESDQLKAFVKQIQIENKNLKDTILKFEYMICDYINENDRLKQENQHLSLINYSSNHKIDEKVNSTNFDDDICYLTLKWLTYEVANRTKSNNEQQLLLIQDSELELKQELNGNEQQVEKICKKNERLKSQLESCTIHFKHVQNQMKSQIEEMTVIKNETERLRRNEMQYRLEIDQLKSELKYDQLHIEQLERELADMKFKQPHVDNTLTNSLRELLDLKEHEINALKEKLDFTKKTHKVELEEAIKANRFSLSDIKRLTQTDLHHQDKQRELEKRLAKFCSIVKPLISHQQLFIQNPIININELQMLITEIDTQEKTASSLGPFSDCLSLLEAQMKDLHHSIIENHARRSRRWKYKLGFECLACESRWEVTHDIRDLQEACLDPTRFIESSLVEPMAGCSCPFMIDFVDSDVRLCLDELLSDVITKATAL